MTNSCSCKYLTPNPILECISFLNAQIYKAYHSHYLDKYQHWPNNSYLLSDFLNNQLVMLIVNVRKLIIFILTKSIILSSTQCLNHLVDKKPHADMHTRFDLTYPSTLFSACCFNWFPGFTRPTIFSNSSSFCITGLVWICKQRKSMKNQDIIL